MFSLLNVNKETVLHIINQTNVVHLLTRLFLACVQSRGLKPKMLFPFYKVPKDVCEHQPCSLSGVVLWATPAPIMLSFLRRTLGRRSIRKHAEKTRFREAQRASTHIPASGEAKSIITCRVSLLDGTDVSVDLPVRTRRAQPRPGRFGAAAWTCARKQERRAYGRSPWSTPNGLTC